MLMFVFVLGFIIGGEVYDLYNTVDLKCNHKITLLDREYKCEEK
jgi:hypothetical protein